MNTTYQIGCETPVHKDRHLPRQRRFCYTTQTHNATLDVTTNTVRSWNRYRVLWKTCCKLRLYRKQGFVIWSTVRVANSCFGVSYPSFFPRGNRGLMVVCSLDSVGLRTRRFHSSEVSVKTRHQLYGVVVPPAVLGRAAESSSGTMDQGTLKEEPSTWQRSKATDKG